MEILGDKGSGRRHFLRKTLGCTAGTLLGAVLFLSATRTTTVCIVLRRISLPLGAATLWKLGSIAEKHPTLRETSVRSKCKDNRYSSFMYATQLVLSILLLR